MGEKDWIMHTPVASVAPKPERSGVVGKCCDQRRRVEEGREAPMEMMLRREERWVGVREGVVQRWCAM